MMGAMLLAVSGCSQSAAPPVVVPVPVTTARAVIKTLPLAVEGMGSVEPYNSLEIVPRVSGQLLKFHFLEGAEVQQDALLVTIDPAQYTEALHQAEALLASDESALEFSHHEAQRYADLTVKTVSRSDIEKTRAAADVLEHRVQADRAVVEEARLNVGYCAIRAPITGRAGAYLVNQGSVVEANKTTLLVVNQIEPIYVTFSVPEKNLAGIRAAQQPAALAVEARLPGVDAPPRLGRLTFIDNTVDAATGMIRLKGTFANADAFFWPGQFVRVSLIVGEERGVVVIPAKAVQAGPKGALVLVVKPNQTVVVRPVQVARLAGEEAVIAGGVSVGEVVVTDGQNKLKDGVVVAAAAEPSAAASAADRTK